MTKDDKLKVVIFRIGQEELGLPIHQVISIESMNPITKVPHLPAHVLGVTDIRGEVIPVVDLHEALTKEKSQVTDSTRIIIVQTEDAPVGLVVDAATDVLDIESKSVQTVHHTIHQDYFLGVANWNERLILLLDAPKLIQNMTNLEEVQLLKAYI